MFTYRTRGTCSTAMDLEIRDGIITKCVIHNGCKGNTQGLAAMVIGPCPDQLAKAIRAYHD